MAATPRRDAIAEVLHKAMPEAADVRLSQFAPRSAAIEVVYLSTPITTGPRLLAWLADRLKGTTGVTRGEADAVRQEVVDDNIARLIPLRNRIVAGHPGIHLIDPTVLEVPGWKQWEYHRFWAEVLISYVDRVVFADGWDLSTGCTIEYAVALDHDIPMFDSGDRPIEPPRAAKMLTVAAEELRAAGRSDAVALAAASRAEERGTGPLKDATLADLAKDFNVASFVSFTPDNPRLRHQVLPGEELSGASTVAEAVARLFEATQAASLNVRTFSPSSPKGNPFYYGLDSVEMVVDRVRSAATSGYFTIVNETVDVHDGGVSGVTLGGLTEFAPDDTPRAVEAEDTAKFPSEMANEILATVYGPAVNVPDDPELRIEFSVHPGKVGHRREHVIVWETERVEFIQLEAPVHWPNRFSSLLGDKTFGLLIANACGVHVPATTALCRRVAPFSFGQTTGSGEWWTRTAPKQQEPGHFTTVKGWTDPFALLAKEDGDQHVAAVLAQEGVEALYSGATLPVRGGTGHIVEGVRGRGDDFMLGTQEVDELPSEVTARVRMVIDRLEAQIGSVRIEWAADSSRVWVLQLHTMAAEVSSGVISPGSADRWLAFDPEDGIDKLRDLVGHAMDTGAGVEVTRLVGVTSHVGDILRKARVPARFRIPSR